MAEALGFSKSERRRFNDAEYVLSVAGDTEALSIEVEHAEDGRRWRSRFAASFVEEITRRTGNAKKFDVFVRMLLSALAQESDSVYLDVLTARDLEMLRRHANPQGPPSATPITAPSDKRYVILTYRAEFDKVHYPLPLPLDERSEEDVLRGMVGRLKSELQQAHETISQLQAPKGDGEQLQAEQLEILQRQNQQLSEALKAMTLEAEQIRAELRLRVSSQGQQNHAREDEVLRIRNELTRSKAEVKSLKDELKQRELAQKRTREKEAAELRAERQKAERLQTQLKKLEEEKRNLATRVRGAERRTPSRPPSRTPSAERRPASRPASRPPSRPASRPTSRPRAPPPRASSRASSAASSRERTPSPSAFLARGRPASGRPLPRDARSAAQSGSPGREARGSPGSTLSPYRRAAGPSRERTPSPLRGAGAAPAPAFSLREKPGGDFPGARPRPVSRRYGGGAAPPAPEVEAHEPGSLFGLAANLGLGAGAPPDEACDIDARLQALQSFLKQTKNLAA